MGRSGDCWDGGFGCGEWLVLEVVWLCVGPAVFLSSPVTSMVTRFLRIRSFEPETCCEALWPIHLNRGISSIFIGVLVLADVGLRLGDRGQSEVCFHIVIIPGRLPEIFQSILSDRFLDDACASKKPDSVMKELASGLKRRSLILAKQDERSNSCAQ